MSEVAKDRLLAVGARFANYEHANNKAKSKQDNVDGSTSNTAAAAASGNTTGGGQGKMSFWKKNSGKVPGRYVYNFENLNYSYSILL